MGGLWRGIESGRGRVNCNQDILGEENTCPIKIKTGKISS